MNPKDDSNHVSWLEKYERKLNNDGTVDILLPKPSKKEQKTIRLYSYHIDFLKENYSGNDFSESLRLALDDLFKSKGNVSEIVLITKESR